MINQFYEFPLNEKMRLYLRIESMMAQIKSAEPLELDWQYGVFFRTFFELIDLLERSEIRNSLFKDFRRLSKKIELWINAPNVNIQALQNLKSELQSASVTIPNLPKLTTKFANDSLLFNVKKKINIPGGLCSFDSPMLHFWLKQNPDIRQRNIKMWLTELNEYYKSIRLVLKMYRASEEFKEYFTDTFLYQGLADDIELLRIAIDMNIPVYPMVSSGNGKFFINFLRFSDNSANLEAITFTMALC